MAARPRDRRHQPRTRLNGTGRPGVAAALEQRLRPPGGARGGVECEGEAVEKCGGNVRARCPFYCRAPARRGRGAGEAGVRLGWLRHVRAVGGRS